MEIGAWAGNNGPATAEHMLSVAQTADSNEPIASCVTKMTWLSAQTQRLEIGSPVIVISNCRFRQGAMIGARANGR